MNGYDPDIPGYDRYEMRVDHTKSAYTLLVHDARLDDEAEFQCQRALYQSLVTFTREWCQLMKRALAEFGPSHMVTLQWVNSRQPKKFCFVLGYRHQRRTNLSSLTLQAVCT
ncbi:hypothetical protein TNIN_282411 [Trichonephila inaurata madagascariensis]|uniref:Uncharacterized protein n=1 Tax=Trichonephila inaurata madagascariensis TaxID=2747483 RepID=A0A8X6YKF4_9ARAC|nr:hypothetical protein TNIN_282411 [Trichonephila inaurata madagascariensis]